MKLKPRTIEIAVIVLAVLTLFNIGAIAFLDYKEAQPQSGYSVMTMGAAFKSPTEPNVIEVNLIRPPRVVVYPGETAYSDAKITNTANFQTYLRAAYRVDVKDVNGNLVPVLNSLVDIEMSDGWYTQDGYWYYKSAIQPGESIPGPIKSITYSEFFVQFIDSQVYVPVLIESVEAVDDIDEVDYWPRKNLQKIEYYNGETVSWTTRVVIE